MIRNRNYTPKRVKNTTPPPAFTPGHLIEARNIKRGDIIRVEWTDGLLTRIVFEYQAVADGGSGLALMDGAKVYRVHEAQTGRLGYCGEDMHDGCKVLCACECHFRNLEQAGDHP